MLMLKNKSRWLYKIEV